MRNLIAVIIMLCFASSGFAQSKTKTSTTAKLTAPSKSAPNKVNNSIHTGVMQDKVIGPLFYFDPPNYEVVNYKVVLTSADGKHLGSYTVGQPNTGVITNSVDPKVINAFQSLKPGDKINYQTIVVRDRNTGKLTNAPGIVTIAQ